MGQECNELKWAIHVASLIGDICLVLISECCPRQKENLSGRPQIKWRTETVQIRNGLKVYRKHGRGENGNRVVNGAVEPTAEGRLCTHGTCYTYDDTVQCSRYFVHMFAFRDFSEYVKICRDRAHSKR
ncbi:hypothetical protein AB6A40_006131 [Gnathostoma spinigerum]|uniref:Secreted protein n=1 Tax=Gnathostoma spinigerum TaxID=75299 RepID=A0ABD6EJN1_9BILA